MSTVIASTRMNLTDNIKWRGEKSNSWKTRYDTIYISPPNMQNLPKLFKDKYKCGTIETKIQFKTMVASGVRQGTEVRRGTARVFIYFSSLNLR